MTRRKSFCRAVIPVAALVGGLTMVGWQLAPDALAKTPNHLHIYIQNLADVTAFVSGSNVIVSSDQLGVGQTEVFKAHDYGDLSASTIAGSVTFSIPQESGTPSCAAELHFKYTFNHTTGHCDDKNFTLYKEYGSCTIQQQGNCFDASSCECKFAFERS